MKNPSLYDAGSVRAGALDGPLRPKIVGLAENLPGPSWCAILIEDGLAEVAGETGRVVGPSTMAGDTSSRSIRRRKTSIGIGSE